MPIAVEVVEIIERSQQGATQPFLCRAADDNLYYVKGSGAGKSSLICEWICAELATAYGLPIAPYKQLQVAPSLIQPHPNMKLTDLGAGIVFGSQKQTINEVTIAHLEYISAEQQQALFLFDHWINNLDRTLTKHGGNPNLFWQPYQQSLVVIDHNLAFDKDYNSQRRTNPHIFRAVANELSSDFFQRDQYNARFAHALNKWPSIKNSIPNEWWYADSERTIATDFDIDAAYRILNRYHTDEFWRQ